MKKIGKHFFEGLLILVPAVGSLYIIYAIFRKIDGILQIPIPGVGFLITIVFITVVGFLASNYITSRIITYFEDMLARLPVVKLLYTSIKDLVNAFVGEKKSFNKPVLVTIDVGTQAKAIGFVTREDLEFLSLMDHVAVYIPQSYNFAGNLFIYPADLVMPVAADSADVMKFLVSGGVSGSTAHAPKPHHEKGHRFHRRHTDKPEETPAE
jgi:uncharacterized membrane protein